MKRYMFMAAAAALAVSGPVSASTPSLPKDLRHVYLIMMENHSEQEIIGNANAPFINSEAATANVATSYYAVGHPSLVNYLEVVGGSNFGVTSDYWPNWAKGGCVDNAAGSTGCTNAVPPLAGTLFDVATPATATATNGACNGQLSLGSATPATNNCAIRDYASEAVTAETIADQLVAQGFTWKSYQQTLPTLGNGIDGVNYSDGSFTNLSSITSTTVIPKLYAVKHNPFIYMANVQAGTTPGVTEAQIADFDGTNGLFADLARNAAPNFSFIVPDQCHDIHKLTGTEAVCNQDGPSIQLADAYVKKIVTAIKASASWKNGSKSAIIIMFDENDYANAPNVVPFIVDKNYGTMGVQSTKVYDHFSLLKTLDDAFGLPRLNHANDATSVDMADLFDRN